MVLTEPQNFLSLPEFGILIPIRDNRIKNTLEALKQEPKLLGKKWLSSGVPLLITKDDLLRVHETSYVEKLYGPELEQQIIIAFELVDEKGNYHRYEPKNAKLPLTELRDRLLRFASGTYLASKMALKEGFVFFTGGGMHHGHFGHGSGFCLINDIIVAIRKLQSEGLINTAWVVDVDAHKGDGTAALAHKDPQIKTMSIHMGDSWPLDPLTLEKAGEDNPVLIPSDVEIPIYSGEEELYLEKLENGLAKMESLGLPDLVIVVDGSDPYEHDELPSTERLRLKKEALLKRDLMVYDFFQSRGIPTSFLMAGGYGDRVWEIYAQFLLEVLPKRLEE